MTTARPVVQTVTIPLADYAELLDCRRRLAELKAAQSAFERPVTASPTIGRNPELAVFVAERLGRVIVRDIRAACVAEFGEDRAPSEKAIYRYWARLRGRRPT